MILLQLIDAGIVHAQAEVVPRNYLGASAIGHPCPRHVQFQWLSLLGRIPGKEFPPRIQRIFERGHVLEASMKQWMERAGFVFRDINDPSLGFSDFEGKFRGHYDGVIVDGPSEYSYPMLWENKALNNKNFIKFSNQSLLYFKPKYYGQVQVYMDYGHLPQCLFTALNSDTMDIAEKLVEPNPKFAQSMRRRAEMIFELTDQNKYIGKVEDRFNCTYCDWNELCRPDILIK